MQLSEARSSCILRRRWGGLQCCCARAHGRTGRLLLLAGVALGPRWYKGVATCVAAAAASRLSQAIEGALALCDDRLRLGSPAAQEVAPGLALPRKGPHDVWRWRRFHLGFARKSTPPTRQKFFEFSKFDISPLVKLARPHTPPPGPPLSRWSRSRPPGPGPLPGLVACPARQRAGHDCGT